MEQQEREQSIDPTPDKKIEQSKDIIKQALNRFSLYELCLAWTGGKDSTTMLWLYREACKELEQPLARVD